MTSYRALICVAHGIEEMETVTTIDILRRAGFDVKIASAEPNGDLEILCSRGVKLIADAPLVALCDEEYDCVILPGGLEGAKTLGESALVLELIKQQARDDKWVAAICAAPYLVLEKNGLYPKSHKSCHPAFIDKIPPSYQNLRRVFSEVDHKLITSQGPGTSLEFAVEIVYQIGGKALAREVIAPMVVLPHLNYDKKFAEEIE